MKRARSQHPSLTKAMLELTACVINLDQDESSPCCPVCEQVLNLHQPDENLPSQLLATCDSCQRWYCLFGITEDPNRFFMLALPERAMIEEAGFAQDLDGQD